MKTYKSELSIDDIGDNNIVTILINQGDGKQKKEIPVSLLNLLAQKHLETVTDLHDWLETCKFIYISEAFKKYGSISQTAREIGVSRNHLSIVKQRDRYLEMVGK